MQQHTSLATASLAAAESLVAKARMERSTIEFQLQAGRSRIESLQTRAVGLREQHAKALEGVDAALARQAELHRVLQPIAPWLFPIPAGN